MSFVTAAAGRRDNYQVPIALAEADLLACHVTDAYAPDNLIPLLYGLGGIGERVLRRHNPALPSRLVHPSRRLPAQKLASTLVPWLRKHFAGDQDPISMSALAQANQRQANLLLYAGYAFRAFTSESRSARRRGLFQYHPHIHDSAAILREDASRYPFLSSTLKQLALDERDPTNLPELEIADLIICNSTFTAATCQSVGIPQEKLRVIPYGIDPIDIDDQEIRLECKCQFLFVGTGIQRKGLHHLLLAWKRANLRHSHLTIVSRWIHPGIRTFVDPGSNVTWLTSVSNQELAEIYGQSHVFVMPSLVEGFGYVYLEAMARGCFCIGTTNTGLPNFGSKQSRALVPAGAIRELSSIISCAEDKYLSKQFLRQEIAADATRRNWESFRRDIRDVALELDS
jgi:glycosyltransferase involved in cell wall biosynthesis